MATKDMSLTVEGVIRIYGRRWGIEVFFKVCKSFLRLEKDSHYLSYDAMAAHVSIVFTRYMFLSVKQRECKDARSLGNLERLFRPFVLLRGTRNQREAKFIGETLHF